MVVLALQSPPPSGSSPFLPWGKGGPRTVNAIEFTPDGSTLLASLFVAEHAKWQGVAPRTDAPEIALYESRRDGDGWSAPRLLPFAGVHKDYEATLSPDGNTLIFNSIRGTRGTAAT